MADLKWTCLALSFAFLPLLSGCGPDSAGAATASGWKFISGEDSLTGKPSAEADRTYSTDGQTVKASLWCGDGKLALSLTTFDSAGKALPVAIQIEGDGIDEIPFRYVQDGQENDMGVHHHSSEPDNSFYFVVDFLYPDEANAFTRAKSARMEVPFRNGQRPIIDLSPQDNAVQQLAKWCLAHPGS